MKLFPAILLITSTGMCQDVVITRIAGDATQAIQCIIDELNATGERSIIELRNDITVSGQITIGPPGVSFHGRGATITQRGVKKATLRFNGTSNTVVDGIRFVGNGTETPWAKKATSYNGVAGVMLVDTTDASVRNCTFTNHAGGSIVTRGESSGTMITNNRIRGVGTPAITGGDNGSDAGISFIANLHANDSTTVVGNQISGHCFGILGGVGNAVVIANNLVTDIPGQHGIYIAQGADATVITGNVINGCHYIGIKLQHQLAKDVDTVVSITGNTVRKTGNIGIGMAPAGAGVGFYIHNARIGDNNIYDCGYGVYVKGCKDFAVTGNRIRKASVYGIAVLDSGGSVRGNSVHESEYAGLYIDDTQDVVTVDGLTLVDCPLNVADATGDAWRSAIMLTGDAAQHSKVHLSNISMRFEHQSPQANNGLNQSIYSGAEVDLTIAGQILNELSVGSNILGGLSAATAEVQSCADSEAPNNSVYYSTTASALVYKNSSGTVNEILLNP